MSNIKNFGQFIFEASGNYGSIDANGHQIDYYATDWTTGKMAYISIINRNGIGWVLRKIGVFFELDQERMIQYNNEIQHIMLDSAIKRDKYEFFLCKNESEPDSFKVKYWQETTGEDDPTGSIKDPEIGVKTEDYRKQMELLFPFIYFTNTY